jgi:MoCo/4Fe-4S cofactor protein with predicted Tat translocation signal
MENMEDGKQSELVQIKAATAPEDGAPQFWRSLDELNGSPEFEEQLHREFPEGASEWTDELSRRGFLKLATASMALAGLSGCTKLPIESIVPYVRQPEEIVPGKPMFYATAVELGGYAQPLLARSNEGRPTKIEGNPEHPESQGGTDLFSQGALYDLYDPYRSQTSTYLGEVRPWPDFIGAMQDPIAAQRAAGGAGFRILTESISSPTLGAQLRRLQQKFPQMKWHTWEPVNRDSARAAARMIFGQPAEAHYRLENAAVILSLDADFLYAGFPGFVRMAREWGRRRNPDNPQGLNRMYAIESCPTSTGMKADHRLPVKASEVEGYARALAARLGVANAGQSDVRGEHAAWLDALAKDLQAHRGTAVVIPGETQPPAVHALAHLMNEALGAVGSTVVYTDPVVENPVDNVQSLRELAADMTAGKVQLLLVLGGNPAWNAPADVDMAGAMSKVPLRIHHARYQNETTAYCHWHVNATHFLEEWSDLRAANGMVTIVQPLIAPMYGGRSAQEVLAVFDGQPDTSGYELVRAFWRSQYQGADFEGWWRQAVHDGFVAGSEYQPKTLKANAGALPPPASAAPAGNGTYELIYRFDPSIYDGRFADNAWLQEIPKPLSKLTWDNVLFMGPAMAKRLGVHQGQNATLMTVNVRGKERNLPVWVQGGHPDDCVTAFFGYGRNRAGRTGSGKGVDVYGLRFSDAPHFASGAKLSKTGGRYTVASTQGYQVMDGRNIIRAASVATYKQNPHFAHENNPAPARSETMYPNYQYPSVGANGEPAYAWGMSIDLNACVGCNTCIIACQAENNIAVVGKEQVLRGRHMHWLRVDVYYEGDASNPRGYFEPLPCMQCEDAPCELVCPVNATVHSAEGLNDMVYNRCVGTRYCSNNCPWKVRRFNFFLFSDWNTPQLKMMNNPEVTVRSRGVMEKCSYCVQRIQNGRIASEIQDRRVRDGEVLTACQQVCPSNAIVFGDINDPNSSVRQLKGQPRTYGVLEELNTRPRTTYLAAVLNPNPEMPDFAAQQQPEQHF